MTIEGEITVRLDWDGRRVCRVRLTSTRPFAASRVFAGREPSIAAAMAPRLFSVCAQAQGAAATAALAAAAGEAPDAATLALLERRVALETIHEYLWRLLIDLPKAMGGEPSFAPVAAARAATAGATAADKPTTGERRTLAHLLERIVAEHVFGRSAASWLLLRDASELDEALARAATIPAMLLARLSGAQSGLGASDVALMPGMTADVLREFVAPAIEADSGFVREPRWNGEPVETGALARMHRHPCVASLIERHGRSVATRVAARMFELAQLVVGVASEALATSSIQALALRGGAGLAAVQTARGLLLHRAEIAHGLVRDYRIVAPTEWNFHPDGALVRGLNGHEAADEPALLRDARLAVQALDPCVGCRLEVGHA